MAPGAKHSAVAAPDGGWGWMIVAGCFITTICTRAVTRCISIFFVEFHMHFSSEYSRTAWIHSLVDCTTMLCAPLGSYIGNRLSCRVAVMVGGLLSSVGLILSSFASSLEYLYLSLGILTGVGFALCYTPAVAMVGTYFSERKALAYGIAMSGSGIGTFVLAPVVQLLIEHYSWRGALLILGGVVSHLCVCGALMRPLDSHCFPIKTEAPGENKEKEGCFFLSATEEYSFLLIPDFLLLSVSFLFLAFGCSVPFVYLVSYSLSIGVSHQQAALLMSVLGVMGIVGNITFGWISDRQCLRAYRRVSYLLAVGLEGLGCLFVPLLRSFSLLVPFSLFYGYFDGAYVALLPVVTSDIVGPTHLSSALGVVCFLHAVPYLISPPIAGWLVDQTGSYTAAFLLCGFSLICSALILATVTLARRCSKGSSPSLLPRIKPSRS
ncbi:monocarboxylate transporter 12-B [Salminus brasiliensis]|uniref:monocarboxylate transporter 12-B n=1 Tax=Salminus brasiliensis TaxID=930266 RepID=UPI003B83911E